MVSGHRYIVGRWAWNAFRMRVPKTQAMQSLFKKPSSLFVDLGDIETHSGVACPFGGQFCYDIDTQNIAGHVLGVELAN